MATQLPFPTINVVPAGFRWSADQSQKALAKRAFIRVGGAQVSRRYLSGANRSWASAKPEENRTIFHTGYRITGTPEAVSQALQYAGVSAADIQNVLNSAITRDNYLTTMAAQYNAEIDAHEALKQAKPAAEGYDWEQIIWFANNIKNAIIMNKTGEQKGTVAAPGRAGAGESLAEKIRKLPQGKVLDVSNMDLNTGKGVRTVAAPKTAKSGKYGTGRVPIISNNIEKYIRAVQLAYGDQAGQYAQDVEVVRGALGNLGTGMPMAAPRVPSPQRTAAVVPGQTLAPAPNFRAAPAVRTPPVAAIQQQPTGTMGGTAYPAVPPLQTLLRQ